MISPASSEERIESQKLTYRMLRGQLVLEPTLISKSKSYLWKVTLPSHYSNMQERPQSSMLGLLSKGNGLCSEKIKKENSEHECRLGQRGGLMFPGILHHECYCHLAEAEAGGLKVQSWPE